MITQLLDFKLYFEKAISYKAYRKLVDDLALEGKTTGDDQSEAHIAFTPLNIQRMNRLDKTIQLDEQTKTKLNALQHPQLWLLIGDAWCGDCAQLLPVINKMAEYADKQINFRIISRDTFPELIEAFQTDGHNAIPKLIALDAKSLEVLFTWGARPKPAVDILKHWKSHQETITKEEFQLELHSWYTKDKGLSTMHEIITLL